MHRQRYNFPMDRILIVSNVTTRVDGGGVHTTGDMFCIYQRRILAMIRIKLWDHVLSIFGGLRPWGKGGGIGGLGNLMAF